MTFTYDPEADALYVALRAGNVGRTVIVDEDRTIDLDLNDVPIGIEVIGASHGVKLEDLVEPFGLQRFRDQLRDIEQTTFRAAAWT
ncbi:MAG: DUF2283 domain-containing protein [Actinomycetota bacterium]